MSSLGNWKFVYPVTQVLQRKTEEAAAATKRLKDLLEARKSSKENCTNGMSEAWTFLSLL